MIVDDYGISLTMVLKVNMPRHSMDLGLDYASLQWHHPGCE